MRQMLIVAPILIPLLACAVTAMLWSRPAAQRAVGLGAQLGPGRARTPGADLEDGVRVHVDDRVRHARAARSAPRSGRARG